VKLKHLKNATVEMESVVPGWVRVRIFHSHGYVELDVERGDFPFKVFAIMGILIGLENRRGIPKVSP
jgi:hypothetical protein